MCCEVISLGRTVHDHQVVCEQEGGATQQLGQVVDECQEENRSTLVAHPKDLPPNLTLRPLLLRRTLCFPGMAAPSQYNRP